MMWKSAAAGRSALYHIYVWQKKPGMEIVERFMDLPHDDDLVVDLLRRVAMKYDGVKDETEKGENV